MLFAWSLTETIRYLFYALSIFGRPPHALLWLRYTTFLPLYPLGAASEAFISFFTLPPLFPPGVSALSPLGWILTNLPGAARDSLLRTKLGRQILWGVALSKTKAAQAVHRGWKPIDALRLAMFVVWWPGTSDGCGATEAELTRHSSVVPLHIHALSTEKSARHRAHPWNGQVQAGIAARTDLRSIT